MQIKITVRRQEKLSRKTGWGAEWWGSAYHTSWHSISLKRVELYSPWPCVCVCVCDNRSLGLPSLQVGPSRLSGHRHRPVTPSQRAPWKHRHTREQSGPKRCPPQSEWINKKETDSASELQGRVFLLTVRVPSTWLLPFSHLCPVLPGGQRHCPVDGSHGASAAHSHVCSQFNPKLPASHAEYKKHTHTHTESQVEPGLSVCLEPVTAL